MRLGLQCYRIVHADLAQDRSRACFEEIRSHQKRESVMQSVSAVPMTNATPTSRHLEGLLGQLAARLDVEGIRYTHWKGSFDAEHVVTGEGDLDLLVDRKDIARFEWVLASLG